MIVVKRGMGGGEYYRTKEGEGSLARDWWNRASSKSADQESSQGSSSQDEAGKASPSQETEDLACLTAVVPRPQQQPPPWQPAKSKPIDIPKKRTTPPPVFEVAQDKRYWYQ